MSNTKLQRGQHYTHSLTTGMYRGHNGNRTRVRVTRWIETVDDVNEDLYVTFTRPGILTLVEAAKEAERELAKRGTK